MRVNELTAVGAAPLVVVRIERGSVRVRGGPDGELEATVEGPDETTVELDAGGARITGPRSGWLRGGGEVVVDLSVPADTRLEIALASGAVDVAGPVDSARVQVASGEVRLDRVGSRTQIKSASGDVDAAAVQGTTDVTTASGDVRIGASTGRVKVVTASGDVLLRDAEGDVDVKTASGDVNLARMSQGRVAVKTMSGDLHVGIPPRRQVSYDVTSMTGELRLPTAPPPDGDGDGGDGDGECPRVEIVGRSVSGGTTISRLDA